MTQWLLVESVSHYSGGTVPDSHRVPFPLARLPRESSIGEMPPSSAVAVDLDVLGDVGPLWHAWLEDAARRARVAELDPGRSTSSCRTGAACCSTSPRITRRSTCGRALR